MIKKYSALYFILIILLFNVYHSFAQVPALEEADSLYEEGFNLSEALEFTEAQKATSAAIKIYETKANLSDDATQVKLLRMRATLAKCYANTGETSLLSVDAYQKALKAAELHFEEAQFIPEIALCYTGLLKIYHNDREIGEHYATILQAILSTKDLDQSISFDCFYKLSIYYLKSEDYQRALEYTEKAIALLEVNNKNAYKLGRLYNTLGLAHINHHSDYPNKKADYSKGITAFKQSIEYLRKTTLSEKLPDKIYKIAKDYIAFPLSNIGVAYGELRNAKGKELGEERFKQYCDSNIHYLTLGIDEFLRQNDKHSLIHYYRVLANYEHLSYKRDKIHQINLAHKSLIANLDTAGFEDEDIWAYPRPDSINLSKVRRQPELFNALDVKITLFAEIYGQTKDTLYLEAALAHYEVSKKFYQQFYERQHTTKEKITFIKEIGVLISPISLYELLWEDADTPEEKVRYLEKIIIGSERNKECIMINQLSLETAKAKSPQALRQQLKESEVDLVRTLLEIEKYAITDLAQIPLRNETIKLIKENRQYTDSIQQMLPALGDTVTKENISLAAIQARLDDATAAIYYTDFGANTSGNGFVARYLVIKKNETQLIKVNNFSAKHIKIFNQVLCNNLLDSESIDAFFETNELLYKALFEPIEPYLKDIKELIIINNQFIAQIPMQLLIRKMPPSYLMAKTNQDYRQVDFREADYLLKHYVISQYPSATLAFDTSFWKDTNKTEHTYVGIAPFTEGNMKIAYRNTRHLEHQVNLQENQHSLGETLALRTFNIRDSTFSNLPGSKEEVLKSAEYFNKESTKTLIGKEASEDAVRHSISKAKIIHLSSHSYINIYNPDLSFIALSQPDTAFIISEDGLLFASEIAQEQYAASLVVLASCESGVGYYLANNGMWSLARYFMQVGVPNIVFTRWRIADKPTTKLMLYFFEYVSEGIPYAQALQKAQLEYLETAPNTEASPYFWGSFTAQCKYSK